MNNEQKLTIKTYPDIKEVTPPQEYINIWEDISLKVQANKAHTHNLSEAQTKQCFSELQRRPYYLSTIVQHFNVQNIAEVGTAEGLQFYTFAHTLKASGGHIWSCDIKDVRNIEYSERLKSDTTFVLGNSKNMADKIKESNNKIDLFYIDGAHDYGDVVKDVINLRDVQSDNPIWIFDDFDKRFGCYYDIERLIKGAEDVKIYRVGNAASGNPNHQVIIRKRF
jgi:hypothetical protein